MAAAVERREEEARVDGGDAKEPPQPASATHRLRSALATRSGAALGDYTLVALLGGGLEGTVWLARHAATSLRVALKMVDKKRLNERRWQRLLNEVTVLKTADHPFIIQLYEVLDTEDSVCMVLEYATGGDLFNQVSRHGPLPERQACRIFAQLMTALDYCHSVLKVSHGDVKLDNMLFGSLRTHLLKLVDFGLSHRVSDEQPLTLRHCGTPAYAAPEVMAVERIGVGYDARKADLWSAGVVLFTLLSGFLPFQGHSFFRLAESIRAGVFALPEHVSSGARDLVGALLRVNPDERLSIDGARRHPWCLEMQGFADLPDDAVAFLRDREAATAKAHAALATMLAESLLPPFEEGGALALRVPPTATLRRSGSAAGSTSGEQLRPSERRPEEGFAATHSWNEFADEFEGGEAEGAEAEGAEAEGAEAEAERGEGEAADGPGGAHSSSSSSGKERSAAARGGSGVAAAAAAAGARRSANSSLSSSADGRFLHHTYHLTDASLDSIEPRTGFSPRVQPTLAEARGAGLKDALLPQPAPRIRDASRYKPNELPQSVHAIPPNLDFRRGFAEQTERLSWGDFEQRLKEGEGEGQGEEKRVPPPPMQQQQQQQQPSAVSFASLFAAARAQGASFGRTARPQVQTRMAAERPQEPQQQQQREQQEQQQQRQRSDEEKEEEDGEEEAQERRRADLAASASAAAAVLDAAARSSASKAAALHAVAEEAGEEERLDESELDNWWGAH